MNQTRKPPGEGADADPAAERKARLAAELRENLKKRKAQQRRRADTGAARPARSDPEQQ